LAQFVLDISITEEASSLSVVPMASSITSMAMGDAIAASLIYLKKFNETDFAINHPGGNLGRKLVTTVESVMQKKDLPCIGPNTAIKDILLVMSSGMFGMVIIVDVKQHITGIITDGDLRRALNKFQGQQFFELNALDIMTSQPKTIHKDCLLYQAEQLMLDYKITALPVIEKDIICGLIAKHHIK
jgi:arabinose-5-phosphate isomerase